jgi:hypothetical protein
VSPLCPGFSDLDLFCNDPGEHDIVLRSFTVVAARLARRRSHDELSG